MKYIISASEFNPQVVIGHGVMHVDLAKALFVRTPISGAGHFEIVDGKVRTYGESFGLNIKPAEHDASRIAAYLGLGYDKVTTSL